MYDYNEHRGLKKCIGREAVNAHYIIVDDEYREIISSKDNCGCLAIGGDCVMMGYWNDPELTAKTMRNGYFYTTDMGYIEDGLVFLTGRKDDMIHIGGYKVAPVEIEDAAMHCTGIEDCVCVAVDDPNSGQAPKLYIVLKEGFIFDRAGISKELRSKLESHKIPKQIEAIDEIPRSSVGKKLRRQLT